MLLDHFFMTFILLIPMWAIIFYSASGTTLPGQLGAGFQFLFLAALVIYMLKDSFSGKSIAKRILKLQVVDNKAELPATAIQCFVRNILLILWPVEVIFTFFNPQRRIGDFLAGTKVVNSQYKTQVFSFE